MILVDTSVWISFFNDAASAGARYIEASVNSHAPLCINGVVEMEILQGIRSDKSYDLTRSYLADFQYFPDLGKPYFKRAVEVYRACRKEGVTIRRSLDCLIAANALIDGLDVVHQDRDFDAIAKVYPEMRVINL